MKCANPTCNNIFSDKIPKFCEECGQLQPDNSNFPFASIGDKNVISNTSTTINNNTIEDDTKKIVICAVSGKRVFLKDSIRCVSCNKDVSLEFYNFQINKCSNCYNNNLILYKREVENALKDQIIDTTERNYLNQKAKELSIPLDTQINIEIEIKNRRLDNNYSNELQGLHKIEFDIAKRDLFSKLELDGASIKFKSVYEKNPLNDTAANYYYFTNAIKNPQEYISDIQNANIDVYWQHYWNFLALINTNDTENSFDKIKQIRILYNSQSDEITIAEIVLYIKCFLLTNELDYYTEAKIKMQQISEIQNELLNQLFINTKCIIDNYNFETNQLINTQESVNELVDFDFFNRHIFQIGINNLSSSSQKNTYPSNDALIGIKNIESIDDFKNMTLLAASKLDTTPFITVGRGEGIDDDMYFQIDNIYLSRTHCKIRALTPFLFEIIDLGSTNGTIVNEVKLYPNVSYFFLIDNKVSLGNSTVIEIKYLYEKLGLSFNFEKPINTNIIYSYSIDAGKKLNLGSLIKISKEYFELNTQLIKKQQEYNNFNIVNIIFGYNNGLMLYYYLGMSKGLEIIFTDNQQFDYNKSIDPNISYDNIFRYLHICNTCQNFIDHQVIDNIDCKYCNSKNQ